VNFAGVSLSGPTEYPRYSIEHEMVAHRNYDTPDEGNLPDSLSCDYLSAIRNYFDDLLMILPHLLSGFTDPENSVLIYTYRELKRLICQEW
jgi:hypothetical protein